MIGLVFLAFAAYMALMTPFVQTRLVDYFTRILEERTGTTISIGRVEFRPIESLILNDVFVRDCRQDTLVFCERLVMKVDSVSFVKRRFTITEAAFEKAKYGSNVEKMGVRVLQTWNSSLILFHLPRSIPCLKPLRGGT